MSGFASADSYDEQEMPSSVQGYKQHKPSVSDTWGVPATAGSLNKVPLIFVHDDQRRYRTVRWIEASTDKSDDLCIARNERLRLFGDGASAHEAIEDLSRQIVHFYEFYRTLEPDQATQDALDFKRLYQDLLVEID